MTHDFQLYLERSRGVLASTDLATIKGMLAGCVNVEKTNEQQDREGIDYVATLRKGATVLIDAKTRMRGCSRWWRHGPELALETWSVRPDRNTPGKVGWTLNETTNVDYILFIFDPTDTKEVFLYPFQLLRTTYRTHKAEWYDKYRVDIQDSGGWTSECVFVPESVVWEALRQVMRRKHA